MTETFNCPNCRASLNYDAEKPTLTVHCDYCGSTVIVPETLRSTGRETINEDEQAERMAQIARLVQEGKKIEAVKLTRDTFGVGLKEAKEMVDALERHEVIRLGESKFEVSQTARETKTTTATKWVIGCVVAIIVVTALIGLIGPILGGGLALFGIFGAERAIDTLEEVEEDARPVSTPISGSTPTPEISPTPGFASEILQFGGQEGNGPGFFNDTRWIGVDGESRIYTGDYQGGRVQVFDASGGFIDMWHADREVPILALAAGRNGTIYLIQVGEIQRYDGITGEALGPIQYPGPHRFEALATAPDGSLVAVNDKGLVRFDRQGNVNLDAVDVLQQLPEYPFFVEDIDVDGAGNIYVVGDEFIYRFDPEGNFADRIGSQGDGPDQFGRSPDAMAIDGQGRLFVKSNDIMVFDPDGRYLDTIDTVPVAFSMAFNDENELAVMDRNGNQVLIYGLNR